MELFPAIDILSGQAVRLSQGRYDEVTTYNPDPVEQALAFAGAGARWIHIVDLDGAKTGQTQNHKTIARILQSVDIGIEVGGGIRSLETIGRYVDAGARRIVLGTKLATDPAFVDAVVAEFGDFLVAGIDARDGIVKIAGWTEGDDVRADDLVSRLGDMGIAHLVFTDIARDGMQSGIDIDRYAAIARLAGFPVVASGGIATIDDIRAITRHPDVFEGAITGRAVYEGTLDLKQALDVLEAAGDGRPESTVAPAPSRL